MTLKVICEGCLALYDDDEAGNFSGWRGEPGIGERPEPVDTTIVATPIPAGVGAVVDIAALPSASGRSLWLVLNESGRLVQFDAGAGVHHRVARIKMKSEPERSATHEPLRRRLRVSPDGRFAAVVTDFGRYGHVVDLATGKVTIALDAGDRYYDYVPFPVALAEYQGHTVVVHRTAANRLDVSDAATGRLLSSRGPTTWRSGDPEPDHYQSYYHGALHVSPDSRWLADDGWVWAPAGIPRLWDLSSWLSRNVWESEDGPSRRELCQRLHLWNVPMCWIGDNLLAISGLGNDYSDLLAGVRIFDAATGTELHAFAGPQGTLFNAGRRLYAAAPHGLEIWDPFTGDRTGQVPGFPPSHHHPSAGELATARDGQLLRWKIDQI